MVNRRIIVLVLIIAIASRLVFLDARPMDHDESVHAYLSYKLLKYNQYSYDPAFHGPLLYFTSAGIFGLLGDNEFSSRLIPVLFSIAGILAACYFERWFGKGVYVFLFIMLFSPSILYYSRYMRNDIILIGSFIVVLYCYFRYLEKKREIYVYLSALFIGFMITSKENGYIYISTMVSFILLYGLYKEKTGYLSILTTWNLKKVRMVIISALIIISLFVSLYTAGFTDSDGLNRATVGAFSHWFTMHEKKDHWKPIYYYANILLQYEFLPLALTITSAPVFIRRWRNGEATKLEYFAAYWLVVSIIVYHVLAHKVPWLAVHLVAPMAFFGAMYSGEIFSWNRRAYRLAFVLIALITIAISFNLTYIDYNNADEDLIYIQVQPSAVELSEIIADKLEKGEKIAIYEPENDYWPIPWYLRNQSIAFHTKWYEGKDFIVTSEEQKSFVEEKGYEVVGKYEIRPNYFMVLMKKLGAG